MKNGTLGGRLLGAVAVSSAVLLAAGQRAPAQPDAELKRLQGYWEGDGAGGKCSITIKDNTLHYRAGSNWFKTTFTLPEGANPRQLHATINDCSPPTNSVGTVVYALFKIEDQTLTLTTFDLSDKPTAEIFSTSPNRYTVKKVGH